MIITFDTGNTSTTVGVFEKDELVHTFRITSDRTVTAEEISDILLSEIGKVTVDGAIIGSVVDELNDRLCFAVKNTFNTEPIFVSNELKMPIQIKIDTPSELGADRIANGVRAYNLYHKAVIVIDFGTATTFDIINSKGDFIGGFITPGLNTQLKSLYQNTSKLPEIKLNDIDKVITTNTVDAILAGVVRGSANMINGMIQECINEMNETPIIILTGGYSEMMMKYLKTPVDNVLPTLTLEGLYDLYKLNVK